MIKKKLEIVEKKLALNLEEIRASYNHRGDRGSVSEAIFRDFIREYLPQYNRVGEGEVIDTNEMVSTQLDVVITNEYHPYLNDLKESGLFIIEGVACAGEVKTNLGSTDIDTLIQSCIKFKSLKPLNQKGSMVHASKADIQRFIEHRPYFIFAYQSQLTIETIHSKLNGYYLQNSTPIEQQIDGVFSLDRGSIINFGDGNGMLKYSTKEKNSNPGIIITKMGNKGILLDFMSWLSVSIYRYFLPNSPLIHYLIKYQP